MASRTELAGTPVYLRAASDPPPDSERRATDLIGDARGEGVAIVAVPVECLGAEFFELRSGLAGAIGQKIVNYRLTLAVIGDITAPLAASRAFRDWVRETNKGGDVWFLPDLAALTERLARNG